MLNPNESHARAITLTRASLQMTAAAGSGHPTSAMSLAHIVSVLMFHHMRFDPSTPDDPSADRLVLSEGHAVPIVYAAGTELGLWVRDGDELRPMQPADVEQLRAIDSPIDGHPNPMVGFPFFPAATGSLGQGLSVAAGLALAARLDGNGVEAFCSTVDAHRWLGRAWQLATPCGSDPPIIAARSPGMARRLHLRTVSSEQGGGTPWLQ